MNEGYLRAVLDNITDGVIAINNEGAVRLFNSAAQRMFGYPESEVLGKDIGLLVPSLPAGQNGGIVREVQGLRKNGAEFQVDLSACEIPNENELIRVFIVHDVTERRQAEQR